MNTLTIIVLLVLAVFALNGYRRGFVKTLASMFFFVLAAALVYYAMPYVSNFLKTKTPVYEMVEEKCAELFAESEFVGEIDDLSRKEQQHIIEELPIPEALQEQLKENNNSFIYESLGVETFARYLSAYLSTLVIRMLSYVVTFVLVMVVLRMTVMTLDIITYLPVIKGVNQTLGLGLGAVQGLAVIWLAFLAITAFAHTDFCGKLLIMINESEILEFFYGWNPLLKYLLP